MVRGAYAVHWPQAELARPGRAIPLRHALPLETTRFRLPPCPELDCVRSRFPPAVIAAAELRAAETGMGAHDALIAGGHLTEEAYAMALARALGIGFDRLQDLARHDCPFDDTQLLAAAAAGSLPFRRGPTLTYAMVPSGRAARHIIQTLATYPGERGRLVLTSRESLTRFVTTRATAGWADRAAFALKRHWPALSAATRCRLWRWLGIAAAGVTVTALAVAPGPTLSALEPLLALVFFHWMVLRVAACLQSAPLQPQPVSPPLHGLPVYTIVVALYREARALGGLIEALRAIDYPREKLDIKIVLEPDDIATRMAFRLLDPGVPFELIVAPDAGPRTKPKALNAALPFARGSFLCVFDAEDRPEPDQLKRAVTAFAGADERLACVQARLTIDNTADSWLTRLYTAEYAGLFDAFLPGIAKWRLPLPLGGTSNHFRTAILRQIGAWDPFNVTEDADLGIRLARHGYITGVIDSSTYEEAPARLAPWLRQRTRWFKGWVQTWQVHMRRPLQLLRELGLVNFLVFQLLVGGSVLSALVHPLFVTAFALRLAQSERWTDDLMMWFYGGTLLAGYLTSAFVGTVGLAHRGLSRQAWWLVLMPFYWWGLSAAAWRALYQVLRDPHGWEKTEHGLARTSRRSA